MIETWLHGVTKVMNKNTLRLIKNIFLAFAMPLRALLNGWPVVFPYPTAKGWRMMLKGISVPIITTGISALEYYRYYVPRHGDLVYDIGGELGIEAEQFSLLVGGGGKVFTFECLPEHVDNLRIISKRLLNVEIVDVACWNKKQNLTFYIGNTQGSSTAITNALGQVSQPLRNESITPIIVQANTLDSMYEVLSPQKIIDYLKMDIEGAEIEALEGAIGMLKYVRNVTIAAYHIRDGNPTAYHVFQILEEAGFDCKIADNLHVYGVNRALY